MTFGGHLEYNLEPQLLIYADFNPINDSINALVKLNLKKLENEINHFTSEHHCQKNI